MIDCMEKVSGTMRTLSPAHPVLPSSVLSAISSQPCTAKRRNRVQVASRSLDNVNPAQLRVRRTAVSCAAAARDRSSAEGRDSWRAAAVLERAVGEVNGQLVGAVGQLALKGLQEAAKDASEVWLQLPPPPLSGTLPPEQLADYDSRFVEVRGVQVHYKECGGGNSGPALLLLHGFGGSTYSWRKVMEPLAKEHGLRVIAFDRPPFGLTSRPLEVGAAPEGNPYTNAGAAQLMLALMDRLGVSQAVAVGHSAGAAVAVEAALQAPERISSLILVAPAVFIDDRASPVSKGDLQAQLRLLYTRALVNVPGVNLNYVRQQFTRWRKRVEEGQGFGYADPALVNSEAIEAYTRPMRAENWDRGALLQFQSFTLSAFGDRIQQLRLPVLVVQGDQDKSVPPAAARSLYTCLQKVTSAAYVDLPNCGHSPMEERSEDFIKAASSFVASVGSGLALTTQGTADEAPVQEASVADDEVTSAEAAPIALS